jgi:hypothetical protein
LTPTVLFGLLPAMSHQAFTEIGLWLMATLAIAFFGYLLVDSLRHRLKWRRLLKKTQESRQE